MVRKTSGIGQAPTDEPKRDVVDAVGIPHETRLGRRVEETCFITDQTVTQARLLNHHAYLLRGVCVFVTFFLGFWEMGNSIEALQPAQLNGGNLVDIFQTREDDFDAVETMEVSYTSSSGEKAVVLRATFSPGTVFDRLVAKPGGAGIGVCRELQAEDLHRTTDPGFSISTFFTP